VPNSALPDHLKGKLHNDWIFPLCYIPRSWTSYKLFQPPVILFGFRVKDWKEHNGQMFPNPCQRHAWAFYLSIPFYFTITFGNTGYYMRIGCRHDDIDFYYTIPSFALKKIDGWRKK